MAAKMVLLVDDDVGLLVINRIALEGEGFEMLTSVNVENEAQGYFSRLSDRDRDSQWLPVGRFVDKPIKPEDLVSAVRTLAGGWTFSR